MLSVPVSGTVLPVRFFPDDTIETVRHVIGLHVNAHPDRLFLEAKTTLPRDYYATNPLHWSALFFRLSLDGKRIPADRLKVYLTQTRVGTGVTQRDITREEWEDRPDDLKPIYDPPTDFEEWRNLGVDEARSFVLPIPPADLLGVSAAVRPIPQTQSLYETLHPYPVSEFRATPLPSAASPSVKLNYYPRLSPDTPAVLTQSFADSIQKSQTQLQALLDLDTPAHETLAVVRAKWYIPLISTRFTAPRTRFEQMFYGMTLSPTTPYVGYFTAKTETTRHKFFCPDPKKKEPIVDVSMWKAWTNATQPQRRLPTLLFYRGTSRTSFDRIAMTDRTITVDFRREKTSTQTLEEMKTSALEWMMTFDAVVPFLVQSDLAPSRWELADLSLVATYAKDIREFDMLRFPCLQSVFGVQNDTFRLLRAEHTSDDISPRELQALQLLNEEDAIPSPEYLASQLSIPLDEAAALLTSVQERAEEINLDKSLRAYPTVKFTNKEVILRFVTTIDRTLRYANILRHVLTSDSASVDAICPRRMEKVVPNVAIPQQELQIEGELAADDDFNALMGFGDVSEALGVEPEVGETPVKSKKIKVQPRTVGTYNYFNARLQKFDPATFDKTVYPGKCDKPKQAVVLTSDDKARVGPAYDFSSVSEIERLEISDPVGTVICPPYWCMQDEIPLREDQLVVGPEGAQQCPVCEGKVRTSDSLDTLEFSVIKRDTAAKFPDYIKAVSTINKRKIPCCFQTPRSTSEVLAPKEEATYVLDSSTPAIPSMRFAYLSEDLAARLSIETAYGTTVKKGRIGSGETDIFRVGLGRPSKTLPLLLNDSTPIRRPADARDNLLQCSFVRTWKGRGDGETQLDRIVSSIDTAYQRGDLGLFEELEYVTTFLKCEVIRVDVESSSVLCGFWSERGGASSRTIALLGTSILAQVARVKEKKSFKTEFVADLRKPMFKDTLSILRDRHARACAVNVPSLSDAIAELQSKNQATYEVILDPFKRIQAVFVPNTILLPIQPLTQPPDQGVPVRDGYADIQDDELPSRETARAFLSETRHAKFKVQADVQDVNGQIVELELASGFRVPVRPVDGDASVVPNEVLTTIRKTGESMLVDGTPNSDDLRIASEVTYRSEIYEFLMISLSTSIRTDPSGDVLDPTYLVLRNAIVNRGAALYKELTKWFKAEAYIDTTKRPVEFVNKVRTPCGQLTDKEKCNSSTLCGWKADKDGGVCKIRVKPIVDKDDILKRMAKTLRDNDKQRALVLDGRMSPFFSTILYLEMPNELITTTI